MANFVEQEIARIRKLVGPKGQVLGAVSGGVDSTVAAKLMHEAIGDRFKAVLVDHGLMRLNEREQVQKDLTVCVNLLSSKTNSYQKVGAPWYQPHRCRCVEGILRGPQGHH